MCELFTKTWQRSASTRKAGNVHAPRPTNISMDDGSRLLRRKGRTACLPNNCCAVSFYGAKALWVRPSLIIQNLKWLKHSADFSLVVAQISKISSSLSSEDHDDDKRGVSRPGLLCTYSRSSLVGPEKDLVTTQFAFSRQ